MLPHSALEFMDKGLSAPVQILSASSICLARGLLKEARMTILNSGMESGCWAVLWEARGQDLRFVLRFFLCSRPLE